MMGFTISLDQRGWRAELGWWWASSKRCKKNICHLLTRGLTLPACRPQPLCRFVLFIQDVDVAYCSWEVTGLHVLPLIVLNAGSCELAMTGSRVQKALWQMWLLLREDLSAPLTPSQMVGEHAPPASWRVAQDSFDNRNIGSLIEQLKFWVIFILWTNACATCRYWLCWL